MQQHVVLRLVSHTGREKQGERIVWELQVGRASSGKEGMLVSASAAWQAPELMKKRKCRFRPMSQKYARIRVEC